MPHDTIVRQRRGVLLNVTKQNSNEVPEVRFIILSIMNDKKSPDKVIKAFIKL